MRRSAAAAAAAILVLAGCGGGEEQGLTIFAAASLGDVAPVLDPSASVVLGGSNDLAAQIRDGAGADVFLSAAAAPVDALRQEGLVGEPVVFASNRLVVIVPAGEGSVRGLADVAREGVKLVLGAEGVPVGDYAREALVEAGLAKALDRVVSLEEDVKGVVGKVALGEADAGIVYVTDVDAAGDRVRSLPVADDYQPEIRYYAALVEPPSDAAEAWLARLRGAEGAKALGAAGFSPVSP